jgi:undecaprenol kinase
MSTDLSGKLKKVYHSFPFAIQGILSAWKQEINLRVHALVAVLVILIGFLLSLSAIEWIVILLTIGGMLSLELLNTAVERVVDLVTIDYHPLAKQAKDTAAGAVLVYAIVSVIVGIVIFLPKLVKYF